jgi:hypothetical protein
VVLSLRGHVAASEPADYSPYSQRQIVRQTTMDCFPPSRLSRVVAQAAAVAAVAALGPALALAGAGDGSHAQYGLDHVAEVTLALASQWVKASFEQAPALVLGLAALLTVPPLALLGLLFKSRNAQADDVTRVYSRGGRRSGLVREKIATGLVPRVAEAWIEVEASQQPQRYRIGGLLIRIGRESDNDICISDMTVHRYHAAVHRSEDGDYVVTDLSSAAGNGVVVNGRAVQEARLANGDRIEVGRAVLRFVAQSG